MGFVKGTIACLGRTMVATIFLVSALGNKIIRFNEVAELMASKGMPQTPVLGVPAHKLLLVGAIAFLILGGLSVALGYKARFGSLMLLVFLGAATYYFHDFWNAEAEQRPTEMIQFLKNFSLAGTMLFFIANGAGPGSLDQRQAGKHRRAALPPQADQLASLGSRTPLPADGGGADLPTRPTSQTPPGDAAAGMSS